MATQQLPTDEILEIGSLGGTLPEGWLQKPISHYHFWESGGVVQAVQLELEGEGYRSSAEPELAGELASLAALKKELATWRVGAAMTFWHFENSLPEE